LAADGGEVMASGRLEEMKANREQALQHAVSDLLEPLVGSGHLKTMVSIEIDASREVSHEEKFDPNSQVERSRHSQTDKEATEQAQTTDPVSVSQNVPGQAQQGDSPGKSATSNTHSGETVNYELNSVRSERVREPGDVKRMTVAVVVDGTTDSSGTFHPRPREELERMAELVRSAVGFDAKRGDKLTVDTMRFIPPSAELGEMGPEPATGSQSWLLAGGGAAAVVVAGAAFLIMRRRRSAAAERLDAAMSAVNPRDAIEGPTPAEQLMLTNEPGSAVTTLQGIFDSHPDEALALVRAWIAEGGLA
jgi:flagellar M-ring protein FliF